MPSIVEGLGFAPDAGRLSVGRAIAEVRSARAVVIASGDSRVVVVSAEAFDAAMAEVLAGAGATDAGLVLPAPRLNKMGAPRAQAGTVALPHLDAVRVAHLALRPDARLDAPVAPASPAQVATLELLAHALVLPAAITCSVPDTMAAGLLTVTADDIMSYRTEEAARLAIVGRAPVPLEGAPESEFVVFRGGEGLRDQVAILVGRPDLSRPVAVRLHSACLTGDLFGSLKCDCGDQLRDTVRRMAEADGGILLYLDQEGRGNGISNKMRAYALQAQGYDTYDADAALGFDLDQRRFDFAAAMLRQLGVTAVRVLTNNPQKIDALKAAGLEVVADQRVLGRPTAENVRYLASKRDRAGHYIDFEALAARAPD